MVILICILLFVLTGIGCWALCAASDTDEYDDEEIKYDQNDDCLLYTSPSPRDCS